MSLEPGANEQPGAARGAARSRACGIASTLLAGCRRAQSNGPAEPATGASARAVACPMGIEGARVTVADIADGKPPCEL